MVERVQTVNPLEMAMEALKEIQKRFYAEFPAHPMEKKYGYATPSTMKPTQWTCTIYVVLNLDSRTTQKMSYSSLAYLPFYVLIE